MPPQSLDESRKQGGVRVSEATKMLETLETPKTPESSEDVNYLFTQTINRELIRSTNIFEIQIPSKKLHALNTYLRFNIIIK